MAMESQSIVTLPEAPSAVARYQGIQGGDKISITHSSTVYVSIEGRPRQS